MATFTQLATDSFATGTTLNANWAQLNTAVRGDVIVDNAQGGARGQYSESAGDHGIARYTGTLSGLTDNQYASIKSPQYGGYGAASGLGIGVQYKAATGTAKIGYELYATSDSPPNLYLFKYTGSGKTTLAGPVAVSLAANAELAIGIESGTLTAYNNGAAISGLSYTDGSPLTGGLPGISAAGNGPYGVDWYGGNFSTGASDTTPPTMTGTLTVTPSTTTASVVCPTAADNVAVTSYECSINGGSTWPFTSATSTVNLTGLTASTSYTVQARAKDAAGNVSTPVLSATFTTSAGAPAPAPAPAPAGVLPIYVAIDPLNGRIMHII